MKSILVIGATSAIAEHCMRIWAQRGDVMFLWGRDAERLSTIANDLKVRGAGSVHTHASDICKTEEHETVIDRAYADLGGIDVVLIAHGVLPGQAGCEKRVDDALRSIEVNAISTIAVLTVLANRFERAGGGTIGVISSVAGERGRASNYVYGSSKAMVTAFCSGLRQRLYKSGVRIVTIKPGMIDTPMTSDMEKGLLWAKPGGIAGGIVRAIDSGRAEVYVPGFWRLIFAVIRRIPNSIYQRIRL